MVTGPVTFVTRIRFSEPPALHTINLGRFAEVAIARFDLDSEQCFEVGEVISPQLNEKIGSQVLFTCG